MNALRRRTARPGATTASSVQADPSRRTGAIVGEAGVGKSRLTYEFTHSHRVQDWLILEDLVRLLRQGHQLASTEA
jgi:hypothetical protein